MRKLRSLLSSFFVLVALTLSAEHLEFMGIPLTGTITNFQSKLQAKGCSLAKWNNEVPTGIRAFTGVFAGKDCNIYIWFNHRTQQVFRARAVVDCSSLEVAHSTFNYYKELLLQKYQENALTSDMLDNPEDDEYEFDMVVIHTPVEVGSQALGTIALGIIEYDTYPKSYGVTITYEDWDGSKQNDQNLLNDL